MIKPPRHMKGGRANPKKLLKGPNGRCLCRWCGTEVPKGQRTFCGPDCVHSWRIRTSASYLQECVLKRDKGVCCMCGVDTEALAKQLKLLRIENYSAWAQWMTVNKAKGRRHLFDVHHVVGVEHGGGSCDLSNTVTLCIACHRVVSAKETKKRNKRCGLTVKR